ncbi:MAG: hypothetical protein K8I82_19780 [Anaerolineae bacterium]|nr:hypothetical protein [Anaerolineae bacterium]
MENDDIQIEISYTTYSDHPVLRKGLKLYNKGTSPISITQLILESLELCIGHPDDQKLYGYYGVQPRELFISGRIDDPALYQGCSKKLVVQWVLLSPRTRQASSLQVNTLLSGIAQVNAQSGEGFIAMNEVPGIMKRVNTAWTWQGGIQLLYDTDIFPFERTLAPGEVFETAKISIAFTQENTEVAPQWVMPTYTSAILHRKGPDLTPVWRTPEKSVRLSVRRIHEIQEAQRRIQTRALYAAASSVTSKDLAYVIPGRGDPLPGSRYP